MNTSECHELVNKYYAEPVFKSWEPSEYDMRYKFNTPRKAKKIDAERAKQNAKLQTIFEKEHHTWAGVHRVIDEIAKYPPEIAELFLNTISWAINDITSRHNLMLKTMDVLKAYGNDVYSMVSHVISALYPYRGYTRITRPVYMKPDEFEKFAKLRECATFAKLRECGTNFHQVSEDKWDYDYPLLKIKDVQMFQRECIAYHEASKNDDVKNLGDLAYARAIQHIACTLSRICKEIDACFEDHKPTKCETDPYWGVKGAFNGILTDGVKRVSFKSFSAGGFNIQRFHYRFKITKLKH